MAIYFVRHAKAGSRERWTGPDEVRPLTESGWRQARAVAEWLAAEQVTRILSSPYVRCMQTLEPLADKVGLSVEAHDALAEGQPFEPVLALLAELPEGAVLCSHGDVIPETVDALVRRGMVVDGEPDWRKGTTWVLEREGAAVVRGRAVPPLA